MSDKLDSSYNRFCLICRFNKLHRTSISEYCTQCGQTYGSIECARRIACLRSEGCSRITWVSQNEPSRLVRWPSLEPERCSVEVLPVGDVCQLTDKILKHDPSPLNVRVSMTSSQGDTIDIYADSKIVSTKIPHLHMIPTISLLKLAERFELGKLRKGDKSWSAVTPNQEVLQNREWLIERLSHVMLHALKLRDKLVANDVAGMQDDNDAAAIAWGGCMLIAAIDSIVTSHEQESSHVLQVDPVVVSYDAETTIPLVPRKPFAKCPTCDSSVNVYKVRGITNTFKCFGCDTRFTHNGYDE